jgi:hypothetical protein
VDSLNEAAPVRVKDVSLFSLSRFVHYFLVGIAAAALLSGSVATSTIARALSNSLPAK